MNVVDQVFRDCYHLSENDVAEFRRHFPIPSPFANKLFFGRRFDGIPDMVCGGPCITNDLRGCSINTFYQILVPLRIAAMLSCPAAIFIVVMEEIITRPDFSVEFLALARRLEHCVHRIAADMGVEVRIVNTANDQVNRKLCLLRESLNIRLTDEQSRTLYSLDQRPVPRVDPLPIGRVYSDERMVACHTVQALRALTGASRFLLVEDAEQFPLIRVAESFDPFNPIDVLAFLPIPDLTGTQAMFRAKGRNGLPLKLSIQEAERRIAVAPQAVQQIYQMAGTLLPRDFSTDSVIRFITYAASQMYPEIHAGPISGSGVTPSTNAAKLYASS